MKESPLLDNVRKIAVLRAGSLGDLIVTLPSFAALRETYPSAELVLLGSPWQAKFFVKGRAAIDRVIVVPPMEGVRAAQAEGERPSVEQFIQQMRDERFDIAISLQGKGIAANPLIREMHPRLTIGTQGDGARIPDRSLYYYYYQHEVMRYLEVVGLAGARVTSPEPCLNVLNEDWREVEEAGIMPDSSYVVINPIANDARRMWPLERYGVLADRLSDSGLVVVFTGSASDSEAVGGIINIMERKAINACGITFGGLCALASRAAMLIGPDTGPIHLAQAVGCPTVGIYWAPNLVNWGPLFRNKHRPVVSWELRCPLCGVIPNQPYPFEPVAECGHEVSFVRDVSVDTVLTAAMELLSVHRLSEKRTSGSKQTNERLIPNAS